MLVFRTLCVFCGSSTGCLPAYGKAASDVGTEIAARGMRLVYGGADVGLMGMVADAVLAGGGEVIGVIPQHLVDAEVAHPRLTELVIVDSMHERKAVMASLADGFVALPGGSGTLEEFCEILTWAQLGLIVKPCGILNVAGYYDPLLAMFDHAVDQGFLRPEHRALVHCAEALPELLAIMAAAPPLTKPVWAEPSLIET